MTDLERAQRLLESASNIYQKRKRRCEATVARWRWSDGIGQALEPYFFEIHGIARGKWLKAKPTILGEGIRQHGFDAGGRVVVTRIFKDAPARFDEEFVLYDGPIGERIWYDNSTAHRALRADVFRVGKRIEEIHTVNAFGCEYTQKITYEEELTQIEKRGHDEQDVRIDEVVAIQTDRDGDVTQIALKKPGTPTTIVFQRPDPSGQFAKHRESLLVSVRDAFVEKLRSMTFSAELYALTVTWVGADYRSPIPPYVSVATVDLRQQLIAKYGTKEAAAYHLWNPAEWSNAFTVELPPELETKLEGANRDLWKNELSGEFRAFFVQLAAELAKVDLPIPKVRDFVCYATSEDEGVGTEDLCKQIPAPVLQRLRKQHLLEGPDRKSLVSK